MAETMQISVERETVAKRGFFFFFFFCIQGEQIGLQSDSGNSVLRCTETLPAQPFPRCLYGD